MTLEQLLVVLIIALPLAGFIVNATIVRLTALSMSSMDMSIEIALRRARKPNVPMANSTPESVR